MSDAERRFREWLDELRQAIMNLPLASHAPGYRFGHRDARHAAAELVSESAVKAEIFGQEDEGPVTEEWLLSIGGGDYQWHDACISIATFPLPSKGQHVGTLDWRRRNGEVHLCGVVLDDPPKTRGDVLRLLRALKIETKGGE